MILSSLSSPRVTVRLETWRFLWGGAAGTQRWVWALPSLTWLGSSPPLTTGTSSTNQSPGGRWTSRPQTIFSKNKHNSLQRKHQTKPCKYCKLNYCRQVEIFHDHRYMAAIRSIRVTHWDIEIKQLATIYLLLSEQTTFLTELQRRCGLAVSLEERRETKWFQSRESKINRTTQIHHWGTQSRKTSNQ